MNRLVYTDPAASFARTVQFTIRTRYGLETHYTADEHNAGPTCVCEPDIKWRNEG